MKQRVFQSEPETADHAGSLAASDGRGAVLPGSDGVEVVELNPRAGKLVNIAFGRTIDHPGQRMVGHTWNEVRLPALVWGETTRPSGQRDWHLALTCSLGETCGRGRKRISDQRCR